jgi:hypothetical protein
MGSSVLVNNKQVVLWIVFRWLNGYINTMVIHWLNIYKQQADGCKDGI